MYWLLWGDFWEHYRNSAASRPSATCPAAYTQHETARPPIFRRDSRQEAEKELATFFSSTANQDSVAIAAQEIPAQTDNSYGIFDDGTTIDEDRSGPRSMFVAHEPLPVPSHSLRPRHEMQMGELPAVDFFEDQILCRFDEQGHCLAISSSWEEITGHPASQAQCEGLLGWVHHDFVEKLLQRCAQKLAPLASDNRFTLQLRHADGTLHWYRASLAPVDGARGIKLCALRNITRDVEAQKTLHKARLEAELALKSRSEFLANMSHELRTPLNAILGFTQIMRSQMFGVINNVRYTGYLENIHDSGQSLLSTINDLLEISNVDAAQLHLVEEKVALDEIIRSVIEIHSHKAFSHHVTLSVSLPAQPVILHVDRLKIRQAISNLVLNAIQHTPPGGKVTLRAQRKPEGGLALHIIDTGCGMPRDVLEKLNDATQHQEHGNFFDRSLDGIGLGLALASEFIHYHQGSIALASAMGKGTQATLHLPATRMMCASACHEREAHEQEAIAPTRAYG